MKLGLLLVNLHDQCIDSLEKPCLGNATQQLRRWRGGGTALLHLVLEEELGSVAGHSQT